VLLPDLRGERVTELVRVPAVRLPPRDHLGPLVGREPAPPARSCLVILLRQLARRRERLVAGPVDRQPVRPPVVPLGGLERVRFATRPEIRPNAPNFADTGLLVADSQQLVGLEFGLGLRRVLVQAEYVCAFVGDAALPVPVGAPPRTGGLFFTAGTSKRASS
jgi:hypothetical protein